MRVIGGDDVETRALRDELDAEATRRRLAEIRRECPECGSAIDELLERQARARARIRQMIVAAREGR